jgi:hypothetical protein
MMKRVAIIVLTCVCVVISLPPPAQCARPLSTLAVYQGFTAQENTALRNNMTNACRIAMPTAFGVALSIAFMMSDPVSAQAVDSVFLKRFLNSDEKIRFIDEDYFTRKIDSLGRPLIIAADDGSAISWNALCPEYLKNDTSIWAFTDYDGNVVFRDSAIFRLAVPHEYVHLQQDPLATCRRFQTLKKIIHRSGSPALKRSFSQVIKELRKDPVYRLTYEFEFYAYFYDFLVHGYYDILRHDAEGFYAAAIDYALILAFADFEHALNERTRGVLEYQFRTMSLPLDVRLSTSTKRDALIEQGYYRSC